MFYWIFDLDDTLYQINTPQRVKNGLYLNYSFITEDKKLQQLLKYLSGKKIIMTNSVETHCNRVLNKLNIDNCFDDKFHRNNLMSLKPHPFTYTKLIKQMNITKDDTCIFFDDTPVNLIMAKKFGWITILITPNPWRYHEAHNSIDLVFPTIHHAIVFLIQKKLEKNKNNKNNTK